MLGELRHDAHLQIEGGDGTLQQERAEGLSTSAPLGWKKWTALNTWECPSDGIYHGLDTLTSW